MSLCEASTSAFSITELDALYAGPQAISPNPSPPDSDRNQDEYKLLTTAAQARIIGDLKSRGIIPAAPAFNVESIDDAAASYRDKLNALGDSMKAEYCWYYKRYSYAIQQWIYAIADSGTSANGAINQYGGRSIALNRRLIDLTALITAVTKELYNTASSTSDGINSLNGQIDAQFSKLKKQAEVLQREAPEAEMKKRMVEFTKEKTNANNNLLSLYFFLDVVALGILFYVYKAA
jgi:hypothetical protein